ncbi:TetR/AcrR family transcriptional regulator [Auraticoccus monumenti]|uniref:TetR/AcrR family transcriptional regulator n=1 Tax=Auraticoccus monumenti TaxID=675864 RepID=UPI000B82E9B9|nr:TetR-like C-terminal domain-containing protein [Auraticoccus monumenti]
MPRLADTAVRTLLVERAADLLARREPVSLRGLVAGTGASTMAVYTHFGGMPGLWRAVRQEGFTRLGARLAGVSAGDDPVRDLAALSAAYTAHALEHPTLYRAMFDAAADLEDPAAAGRGLELLVDAAGRARDAGRFAADRDPAALATRLWASGHGLVLLVIGGVLPRAELDVQAPAVVLDLCLAAGDDPARAAASVRRGWDEGTTRG